ncbi:adenosylmethionine--8-amino-7-oxononanoate transaminase [Aureitalea marina]|uniref:Adenosylmethionine-8-amino-7-oxononanoate aminotransferase n=1 Tax=Aureitalea marina TaxID=930804 RepID=A0A2S7KSS0_9FLAO|nr:adenosylmethionine--8-amino-7-oxononanoate transaminase [Aureitalea marina]PQB05670.1 adenosylmethionine--8-amino-7-oxononanoate transaminase [Aureitalea marina]
MSLTKRDSRHIWHPLTQHKTAQEPLGLVRAEGALLYDEEDNSYVDGIASWYTAMYGHCHPYIIQQVTAQMKKLDQVVFTGFTHEPAVSLSERLLAILPDNQSRIFFNDNGSTSVEAAIKMALQYFHNLGETKDTLIAFENGFHGDTFGAMSASGLSVYNGPFEKYFLNVERIPPPTENNIDAVLQQLSFLIREGNCAAFLYEPLVQGAAGMKMHDADGLDRILDMCKEAGILCIADEVMTGFGKTANNFASDHLTNKPDMICLSKALTAGLVPMGITSCSDQVFQGFLSDKLEKGFFHAHTYSANPLACAAALAGLDLLDSKEVRQGIEMIGEAHTRFAQGLKDDNRVRDIRQSGVILAFELNVEMERYGNMRNRLYQEFMNRGVFLRPLGNTIYILPPYLIKPEELQRIYTAIKEVIDLF